MLQQVKSQCRIKDFPVGGGGGVNPQPIIWQTFCRKLHENETNLDRGVPSAPSPRIRQCLPLCLTEVLLPRIVYRNQPERFRSCRYRETSVITARCVQNLAQSETKMWPSCIFFSIHVNRGGSRISQKGVNSREGSLTYHLPFFLNCMQMKKIGRGGFQNFTISGGSNGGGGEGRVPTWGSQFFQFHAVLGEILAKSYVGIPPGELAPPPRGNPGSATEYVDPQLLKIFYNITMND